MTDNIILPGSNSIYLAEKISKIKNLEIVKATIRKFPDGEIYVRINSDVSGKNVIILQSLFPNQNEALMELILLADCVKDTGGKSLTAIIPYFAYARQDKRFQKGEALSLKTVVKLLKAVGIDNVITVDAHFHRKPEKFNFYGVSFTTLSAGKLLLQNVKKICKNFEVVSPDTSTEILEFLGLTPLALRKVKICPICKKMATECKCTDKVKKYEITEVYIDYDLKNKNVVILDDMIASGSTIISAVKKLKKSKVKKIIVAATHGLFLGNSLRILEKISDYIVVTDTIKTPLSKVSVAELLAKEIF